MTAVVVGLIPGVIIVLWGCSPFPLAQNVTADPLHSPIRNTICLLLKRDGIVDFIDKCTERDTDMYIGGDVLADQIAGDIQLPVAI